MEPRLSRLCICSILAVAALVRLAGLDRNPAGVFHDEAEKGYSAYSVLRVGGTLAFPIASWLEPAGAPGSAAAAGAPVLHRWPVFVDVWGSRTSMIYQYTAFPFVAVLGLNAWSTRLPAALAGTLTVLLCFFLARSLTGRTSVALWAMTLLALSPWHVVFSRWAQQGIFVPLFVICGLLGLLRVRRENSRAAAVFLPLSAAAFGLAFYSYSGAQPFLLLFLPAAALVWRREIRRHGWAALVAVVVLALFLAPTLCATFGGGGAGMGRFERLSIFQASAAAGDHPSWWAAMALFLKHYLWHFSPQFLFLTGDALPRHGVRGFGVMLHVEIFSLIAGIYTALKRRNPSDRLLLAWFVLFPISAALTNEGLPHALRTLHAVPCPQILSAMGGVEILEWLRRKWGGGAKMGAVALAGANAAAFLIALFVYYPHYSAPAFEYGIREAVAIARENGAAHHLRDPVLYVPNGIGVPLVPELFLFHYRTAPESLLRDGMQAAPVRFLIGPPRLEAAARMLRPGDSLLLSPRILKMALRGEWMPAAFQARAVFWSPRPFGSPAPIYVVLCR